MDALCALSMLCRRRVRRMARRGALAQELLPFVWRASGDGATGGQGSGAPAVALVRLLPDAMALSENRLPVLRPPGRLRARGRGGRRGERAAHRLLRRVSRLSQDL